MRILSTNVGSARPLGGRSKRSTGIAKVPVDRIEVRPPGPQHGGLGSGALGDFVGNPRYHGGDDKALYAVAGEELDYWARELGRELPPGMFGENLTTEGLDVDGALVGETWAIGDVEVRVTGPRTPCATFAKHMGEPHWVKRFAARGRPGAYLAIERPGVIEPGAEVEVLTRPSHDVDVALALLAFMGDADSAREVLAADLYAGSDRAYLERVAARG